METTFQYSWIDIVVIIVFVSSTLLSLLRGLIQEVSSLIIWLVAIYAGFILYETVAEALPIDWSIEMRFIVSFLMILFTVLLISKLVVLSLKETIDYLGGSQLDKFFGALFGAVRGGLIIFVLALLGSMTALPREKAWMSAVSRPILELSIGCVSPYLPEFFKAKIIITPQTFKETLNLCVQFSE